jgi:membrane fusion protein, multidrug efflux system
LNIVIIIVCLFLGLAVSASASAEPLRSTGMVMPYQQVELAASSDGVVTEILVKEGEWVADGQVLARLDSAREALEVDYSKVVLEKRVADLATAEMLFNEKIFSKNQVEERRIDAKLAETQSRLAQGKLQSRSIRAPFAGLVLRLYKQRGESLRSLERFAGLADLSRVQITLYLEAANLLRVKTGQVADVIIPLIGQEAFTGVVDAVDPVVDPASGLFRVKVLVDNSARQIRTGTKANVLIREQAADVTTK